MLRRIASLLLVVFVAIVPVPASAQERFELAVDGSRSAVGVASAPGQTSSGSPTGGTTTGAETGPTGPSASPSPVAGAGRFGGPGLIVLGLLIGGFLLLRTRLLRRRP